jgi:hypothetical protein
MVFARYVLPRLPGIFIAPLPASHRQTLPRYQLRLVPLPTSNNACGSSTDASAGHPKKLPALGKVPDLILTLIVPSA